MINEQNLFNNPTKSEENEEIVGKSIEKVEENNNFGVSEKLLGVNNLQAAQKLLEQLDSENTTLAKLAREEWANFGLNEQEMLELFNQRYKHHSPDTVITMRNSNMEMTGEKLKKDIDDGEKFAQSDNRLKAISDNFSIRNLDQEILDMADKKGSPLKKFAVEHRGNIEALNQYNHLQETFIDPAEKGQSLSELCYNSLGLIISRGDDYARRDLILALKLGVINENDLEEGFKKYEDTLVEENSKNEPAKNRQYRQATLEELRLLLLGDKLEK